MAASRRPIVEDLVPRLASAARKAATVSGAAGSGGRVTLLGFIELATLRQ
jgi:hypothetical protein